MDPHTADERACARVCARNARVSRRTRIYIWTRGTSAYPRLDSLHDRIVSVAESSKRKGRTVGFSRLRSSWSFCYCWCYGKPRATYRTNDSDTIHTTRYVSTTSITGTKRTIDDLRLVRSEVLSFRSRVLRFDVSPWNLEILPRERTKCSIIYLRQEELNIFWRNRSFRNRVNVPLNPLTNL